MRGTPALGPSQHCLAPASSHPLSLLMHRHAGRVERAEMGGGQE